MKKTLAGMMIMVALAGCFGCQRGIEPRAQAQQVSAERALPIDPQRRVAVVEAQREAHYCMGITKKGERCRKRVKAEGDYCWMHVDQDKRVKK